MTCSLCLILFLLRQKWGEGGRRKGRAGEGGVRGIMIDQGGRGGEWQREVGGGRRERKRA
eukprot:276525-Rhodomonas_salina.1